MRQNRKCTHRVRDSGWQPLGGYKPLSVNGWMAPAAEVGAGL